MDQIIELLEHWQAGRSFKSIAKSLGVDRKTIRKYVNGVVEAGVTRESVLSRDQWVALLKREFPDWITLSARRHTRFWRHTKGRYAGRWGRTR